MKPLRYYLPETLRWRIIRLVDRLPGQCWSDLCDWAGTWRDDDLDEFRTWPWWAPYRPQSGHCVDGVAECGTCYCGKLRDEPRIREYVDGPDRPWNAGGGS